MKKYSILIREKDWTYYRCLCSFYTQAAYLMIPMDDTQKITLRHTVAYWVLEQDVEVDWLLNYRGEAFI